MAYKIIEYYRDGHKRKLKFDPKYTKIEEDRLLIYVPLKDGEKAEEYSIPFTQTGDVYDYSAEAMKSSRERGVNPLTNF